MHFFSTLGTKKHLCPAVRPIAMIFVHYNLTKKHGLQKSLGGEGLLPGLWTNQFPWLTPLHLMMMMMMKSFHQLLQIVVTCQMTVNWMTYELLLQKMIHTFFPSSDFDSGNKT